MYYVAGVEWINPDLPRYNIQIASSLDGKAWARNGTVAIDFHDGENALARPYVIGNPATGFDMWFSSKGQNYRIMTASSTDGINWQRKLNNSVPETGGIEDPDSDMLCYPVVVKDSKNIEYMFYNGNNYGAEGICLAVKEPDER